MDGLAKIPALKRGAMKNLCSALLHELKRGTMKASVDEKSDQKYIKYHTRLNPSPQPLDKNSANFNKFNQHSLSLKGCPPKICGPRDSNF